LMEGEGPRPILSRAVPEAEVGARKVVGEDVRDAEAVPEDLDVPQTTVGAHRDGLSGGGRRPPTGAGRMLHPGSGPRSASSHELDLSHEGPAAQDGVEEIAQGVPDHV